MICKIVTIVDWRPNYGNQLQNYAVQKIFTELTGVVPNTLVFEKGWDISWKGHLRYWVNRFTGFKYTKAPNYWRYDFWRAVAFAKFRKKYIASEVIDQIPSGDSADYFILGSDQVWNPLWYQHPWKKEMFLLTFAPPEKRICVAPSFGITVLPGEWTEWFKKNLMDFPQLAVREEDGAKIIKDLTGKDAYVMIDPTLMIDADTWEKMAEKPKNVETERDYVLVYVLGEITNTMKKNIDYFEKSQNCKIYYLLQPIDANLYKSDPGNFLYLVKHAKIVITDSFHACVFSFLLERPFLVYERGGDAPKMGSRISTLLKTLKLENRYVSENDVKNVEEILNVDYSEGKRIIKEKKKETIAFLKRRLMLK